MMNLEKPILLRKEESLVGTKDPKSSKSFSLDSILETNSYLEKKPWSRSSLENTYKANFVKVSSNIIHSEIVPSQVEMSNSSLLLFIGGGAITW